MIVTKARIVSSLLLLLTNAFPPTFLQGTTTPRSCNLLVVNGAKIVVEGETPNVFDLSGSIESGDESLSNSIDDSSFSVEEEEEDNGDQAAAAAAPGIEAAVVTFGDSITSTAAEALVEAVEAPMSSEESLEEDSISDSISDEEDGEEDVTMLIEPPESSVGALTASELPPVKNAAIEEEEISLSESMDSISDSIESDEEDPTSLDEDADPITPANSVIGDPESKVVAASKTVSAISGGATTAALEEEDDNEMSLSDSISSESGDEADGGISSSIEEDDPEAPIGQEVTPSITKTPPTVSSGAATPALSNVAEPLEDVGVEDSASLEEDGDSVSSVSDSLDTTSLEEGEEESPASITTNALLEVSSPAAEASSKPNKKEGNLRRRKRRGSSK